MSAWEFRHGDPKRSLASSYFRAHCVRLPQIPPIQVNFFIHASLIGHKPVFFMSAAG